MMRVSLIFVVVLMAVAGFAQTPPNAPAAARKEMNAGVQAYKAAHYEDAMAHFRAAVDLAPDWTNARLYLATASAQMYIPGVDTPENVNHATLAIDEFKRVDAMANAGDVAKWHALKSIASLYFNMKRLEEAADWYQRAADADPQDAEVIYFMGVIRWTEAYQPRMESRAKLGLQPTDPMPPGRVCAEIRAKNQRNVQEGIRLLNRALELRPAYDDAMAYLNLLYRERADYECDDPQARAADIETANRWVDRTIATKKANPEAGEALQQPRTSGGGGGTGERSKPRQDKPPL